MPTPPDKPRRPWDGLVDGPYSEIRSWERWMELQGCKDILESFTAEEKAQLLVLMCNLNDEVSR